MKQSTKIKLMLILFCCTYLNVLAQRGYYDAPYFRHEADLGQLINAIATSRSYAQANVQSEASNQVCVNLSSASSAVSWTVQAGGDGLVVRFSIPDGQTGALGVYADNVLVDTLQLSTYYSWENLGLPNANPRMRFDEVRVKLPAKIVAGGNLKLAWISGNISLDFAELETVPAIIPQALSDTAYSGDGSTLQKFIDANGGRTIYLPKGIYNVNSELYFGVAGTTLKGAGMWYTEIHFTNQMGGKGGLRGNASAISFSDMSLTTVRNSRNGSYKGINGVFTAGSTISNLWVEHFECGAWIGQYNTGPIAFADGFTMTGCRFRNNYADGTNLCKGTRNAVVEHCSYRNNGDDDMAIWSAGGMECQNNTFRYNTAENCWRSAGCAIYGGLNNKAYNLIIKDNLEVGLKVNNSFAGAGFNDNGMHEFHDIDVIGCGTFNDLFNGSVGAIDIACDNVAGTSVKNLSFTNINITDSKNDAIYIYKKAGVAIYNLTFRNITVNGTGNEFPDNNIKNLNWGRGYGILFVGNPSGDGVYCNMTYTNRGGNATSDINNAAIGAFNFVSDCSPPSSVFITSPGSFGLCTNPVNLSASATPPQGDTLASMEFFVDNVSIGKSTGPASIMPWTKPTLGSHKVKAIATYLPSNTTSSNYPKTLTIEDGIFTNTAPVIDGTIDDSWKNFKPFSLNLVPVGKINGPSDLSASFKISRDANNLYIMVDVTDDILLNNGKNPWENDRIELYIDMGNGKSGPYIQGKDFQFDFTWNITTPQPGITFAQTTKTGNLGYTMEIMLPWTTLGGIPAEGSLMGIEVEVEDNDTGVRDGKLAWKDGTDNSWQSTSVFGTLQIANCVNTYVGIAPVEASNVQMQFFPNPFMNNGHLNLNSTSGNTYSVNLLDVYGKLVWNKTLPAISNQSIGENLAPGMYIIEVSDGRQKQSLKLIKLE